MALEPDPIQSSEADPFDLLEDALITIEVGARAAREALKWIRAAQLEDLPQDSEPAS